MAKHDMTDSHDSPAQPGSGAAAKSGVAAEGHQHGTKPAPKAGATPDASLATERLLQVMARLRGEDGCPWDKKQSHRSLIPYLVEEAYELIEAIEGGDTRNIREELGDVLLQVVFHARIAEEAGEFTFADVAAELAEKLETRHPHVFGDMQVKDAESVKRLWHENKMRTRSSALEGISSALPALSWAQKVGSRAARTGYDWNRTSEIFDKAAEELAEFRAEAEALDSSRQKRIAEGDPAKPGQPSQEEQAYQARMEMEFGDLLFAQVQLARWLDIDPESALRLAVHKYSNRFRWMEETLQTRSKEAKAQTFEQWEALWKEAKAVFP